MLKRGFWVPDVPRVVSLEPAQNHIDASPSNVRRLNGVMFSFTLVRIAPSPSGPSPEMRTSFFPKLTDFVPVYF